MKTNEKKHIRDGFFTTGARVVFKDEAIGRDVVEVSPDTAKWDGVPEARLALECPGYPGIYAYTDIRVTGRKWRPDFSVGAVDRLTVRVRFIGQDDTDTDYAADILVRREDEDRAATLEALGLLTPELEELSR